MMTAEGVGPLVFYDERLDGLTYIDVIKNQKIKRSFKQNDRWYYVQDNAPCHKSVLAMK